MIIQKHAKIITAGNENSDKILIVLHGYGQLAQYFIRKFQSLEKDYFIVAPEGMHRFYLEGFSGRIGASWMTKECREWDIQDNMAYLDQVLNTYAKDRKVNLLGFSQGGSTAARYIALGNNKIEKFVLWATPLPEELTDNAKFKNLDKHFVLGTQDQFFTAEQREKALDFHAQLGFENHIFEGNHNIDSTILQGLFLF